MTKRKASPLGTSVCFGSEVLIKKIKKKAREKRNGPKELRPYQKDEFSQLRDIEYTVSIKPTGAGKTISDQALSLDWMERVSGGKTLVIVPECSIGHGFLKPVEILNPETDMVMSWSTSGDLINLSGSKTAALAEFLGRKSRNAMERRIAVCTQSLLCALFRSGRKIRIEGPIRLVIDEAHRLRDGNDADRNALNSVLDYWIDKKVGPVHLMTATWLRSDFADLLSERHRDLFTRYVLPVEKYLEWMDYLDKIRIRFWVGPLEKSLRKIVSDVKPTAFYVPHSTSWVTKEHGTKHDVLDILREVTGYGTSSPDGTFSTHKIGGKSLIGVDLVDDSSPARRARALSYLNATSQAVEDEADRTGKAGPALFKKHGLPQIIFTMNMCKMGWNCTALERVVIIGERKSIVDVIQIMGRAMRDFPGKKVMDVDFVLHTDSEKSDEVDSNRMVDFMKVVMASMVVEWQFRLPALLRGLAKSRSASAINGARDFMGDMENLQKVVAGAQADIIASAGEIDALAVLKAAAQEVDPSLSDEMAEVVAEATNKLFGHTAAQWRKAASDIGWDPDYDESFVDGIRTLGGLFGFKDLADIRSSLGVLPSLRDVEYVKKLVQAYLDEYGELPSVNSGVLPLRDYRLWSAVDQALEEGLHLFLTNFFSKKTLPSFHDTEYVKRLIQAHVEETGTYPTVCSMELPLGDPRTWSSLDRRIGLVSFLEKHFGKKKLPSFHDVDYVKQLVQDHVDRTGTFPTNKSGRISARDPRTWGSLDKRIRLNNFLEKHFEKKVVPSFHDVDYVKQLVQAHIQAMGTLPNVNSGRLPLGDSRTWNAVHRIVPGKLRGFLEKHFPECVRPSP